MSCEHWVTRSGRFNPRARDGRESYITHKVKKLTSFNPRARDGRECQYLVTLARCILFQSTRP